MGYIANFIVYTLAMVGVIVVALLVFKNATSVGCGKNSKFLKVLDTISLGQRKTLYIVAAGKERFLIAGDVNNTCLISKLEHSENISEVVPVELNSTKPISSFQATLESLPKKSYMDKSNLGISSSLLNTKKNKSVIKNFADILKQ
jgi:flagellar biogenesis protein FliO